MTLINFNISASVDTEKIKPQVERVRLDSTDHEQGIHHALKPQHPPILDCSSRPEVLFG
jgi:hypothetical protein